MFRPKPHHGLPSLGIYDLFSPFPPARSRGEVGRALRSRGERQEGRVEGEGWAFCVSGPIKGSNSVHLQVKNLGHLRQMPEAQGRPKPDSGPQTTARSTPALFFSPCGWQGAHGGRGARSHRSLQSFSGAALTNGHKLRAQRRRSRSCSLGAQKVTIKVLAGLAPLGCVGESAPDLPPSFR